MLNKIREYRRICKKPGCSAEFIVSAPALEIDRAIGFSEPEYCPKHRAQKVRSYSRVACHHYQMEYTPEGEQLVRNVERVRTVVTNQEVESLGEVFDPWEVYGPGGLGRFQRTTRAFLGSERYTPLQRDFPIAEKYSELEAAILEHQVVVLVGPTGSGKSTYVPWRLLTGGTPGQMSDWARRGTICVTQPRIQATRSVPRFISETLNGTTLGAGGQIGFSHSGDDQFDRRTRLIFKTDGKLINDIASGAIAKNSIVMIDEAHERSANIDLILALMRWQLPVYPDLRLIIASATIDHELFQEYFSVGGRRIVPIVKGEGRSFPIQEHWWGDREDRWWEGVNSGRAPTREELPIAIADLVRELAKNSPRRKSGSKRDDHILVFQPGSREILETVAKINGLQIPDLVALPLYSQLSFDEQRCALDPCPDRHANIYSKRRVVVSTNLAETSLTVEGVRYVIDSGLVKESYWNPATGVSELRTVRHSRSGCRQRWGRGGRVAPGDAYMLYSKNVFERQFPEHTIPELARSSLEQVVLTGKVAGARTTTTNTGSTLALEWMPLPEQEERIFRDELERAYSDLRARGAIDSDGDLTEYGLELRGIPAELDVARVYTEAEFHGMGFEAATLVPFLKLERGLQGILRWDPEWDSLTKLAVRNHQLDLVFGCRDDLERYLKIWLLWENIDSAEKKRWHEELGFNREEFEDKIESQRRRLIESVMDWRKAEHREIDICKIDSLRALIAHCLQNDLYGPLNDEVEQTLNWDAFWDEDGAYEDYDDAVKYDSTVVGESSHLYQRLKKHQATGADLLEIAPTSACFANPAKRLVCCGRRPNNRPQAKAKVFGINAVRVSEDWLKAIRGTVVDRTRLYATISRQREPNYWRRLVLRLMIPWIVPRGTRIGADELKSSDGVVTYDTKVPNDFLIKQLRNAETTLQVKVHNSEPTAKAEYLVVGHELSGTGTPQLVLYQTSDSHQRKSRLKYRIGQRVTAVLVQKLEDPLGFSPMFLVHESLSDRLVPLTETDMSGGSQSRPEFVHRYQVGDPIELSVGAWDERTGELTLSRGPQLYREFKGISLEDRLIYDNLRVIRVDGVNVHIQLSQSGYTAIVPRSSFHLGSKIESGDAVRAMFRRRDRTERWDVEKIEAGLRANAQLPKDIDLGVILDPRLPDAYDRFCQHHGIGEVVYANVRKHLDSGALLVELSSDGLTAIVYESELGVDHNGKLVSAQTFRVGARERFFIFGTDDRRAQIRLSSLRLHPMPESYAPIGELAVTILAVRQDRNNDRRFWLSGICPQGFAVNLRPLDGTLDSIPRVGEDVIVHVKEGDVKHHIREIRGDLSDV